MMIMIAMTLVLIVLTLLSIPSAALPSNDTLGEYACRYYYNKSSLNCAKVVRAMRANYSFDNATLSTIELGDPSKPLMIFVHGWPDSPVEWINQMEYFCQPPHGRFYCVAPALPNFVPDAPDAPLTELYLDLVVDSLARLAANLQRQDVTWFMHDWGALLGYWVAYKHPDLVGRIAAFDMGNICKNCQVIFNYTYQHIEDEAFRTKDSSLAISQAEYWQAPCLPEAVWRTAWPYTAIWAEGGLQWVKRMTDIPLSEWKMFTPDLPNLPMIFFWGNMTRGLPRKADSLFFSQEWLTYVKSMPFGEVVETDSDHWIPSRAADVTNTAMDEWLVKQKIM